MRPDKLSKKSVYRPGLNLSPYMHEQDPNHGSYISRSQIQSLLRIVGPYTDWVRFFGITNGLEHSCSITHELGLKAAIGIWLSRDQRTNELQMAKAVEIALLHKPEMVIVGSETLYRRDLKEEALIQYIERIRGALPSEILVTTADSHAEFLTRPRLLAALDVVLANFYPFFDGVDVENATLVLDAQYQQLSLCCGKQVIVSETGWPSGGKRKRRAVPSPENATQYFLRFATWAQSKNVLHFYFEAFDEPWKERYEGKRGACFGLWDRDGNLKPGMQAVFDGKTL